MRVGDFGGGSNTIQNFRQLAGDSRQSNYERDPNAGHPQRGSPRGTALSGVLAGKALLESITGGDRRGVNYNV